MALSTNVTPSTALRVRDWQTITLIRDERPFLRGDWPIDHEVATMMWRPIVGPSGIALAQLCNRLIGVMPGSLAYEAHDLAGSIGVGANGNTFERTILRAHRFGIIRWMPAYGGIAVANSVPAPSRGLREQHWTPLVRSLTGMP